RGAFERIEANEGLAPGVTASDAARLVALLSQGVVVSGVGGQTRAMLRRAAKQALARLGAGSAAGT
ncbi:MAG: hypothetical protein AAGH64_12325, partial [Planctomycetota bacterium]